MIKLLAQLVNLIYKLKLPIVPSLIFKLEKFLLSKPRQLKVFLSIVHPQALWKIAEAKLLYVVNSQINSTPALQLIKNKYFPERRITSIAEFKELFPILDKESYIRKFSLVELCQHGQLPRAGTFYKSAGTSGQQTLWVQSIEEELLFDKIVAFFTNLMLNIDASDYVILNCWSLGSWPTGINFAASIRLRGKVLNSGLNEEETLNFLKTLGPEQRYFLAGYPPFVYRLVKKAAEQGLDLKNYHIDIVMGGEGFVEEWRDELLRLLGPRVIFSAYGSTDKGLGEALETANAYIFRSLLYIASIVLLDERKAEDIMLLRFNTRNVPFSKVTARDFLLDVLKKEENFSRIPMVFQFNPTHYYNENYVYINPVQNREVKEFLSTVLSVEAAIPRIRYNIHDEGFVLTYDEVVSLLQKYNISFDLFGKSLDYYSGKSLDYYADLHLPFLFVFGRSDGTVSVDGANIFPEDIKRCLSLNENLAKSIYSFQLFVTDDYRLGIAIELEAGLSPTDELKNALIDHFKAHLAEFSFGYREIVNDRLPSADFVLELVEFNQGRFQDRKIKLRYVKH